MLLSCCPPCSITKRVGQPPVTPLPVSRLRADIHSGRSDCGTEEDRHLDVALLAEGGKHNSGDADDVTSASSIRNDTRQGGGMEATGRQGGLMACDVTVQAVSGVVIVLLVKQSFRII